MINNLKKSGKWKVQLTTANNFISSIDNDERQSIKGSDFAFNYVRLLKIYYVHLFENFFQLLD